VNVRIEWEGKPTRVERLSLPFQTVERINESRATRERDEQERERIADANAVRASRRGYLVFATDPAISPEEDGTARSTPPRQRPPTRRSQK